MKNLDHPKVIDRLYFSLIGSLVTLVVLHELELLQLSNELGILLLIAIPVLVYDIWYQWRDLKRSGAISIHQAIAWASLLVCAGLFVAKHVFGIEQIGFWTVISFVIFIFAGWFAKEDEGVLDR